MRFLTGGEEIPRRGIILQRHWPEAEAAPNVEHDLDAVSECVVGEKV